MAIETCENCKRIIGELEQAYTWQRHILCKECYTRLSNPTAAQPTPVDFHAPVMLPPPQRSLVKSTLIVIATVIAVIVVISVISAIPDIVSIPSKNQEAKVLTTKASLIVLDDTVTQFKLDTGRLPTKEEGLKVLVEMPKDVTNYPEGGYLKTRIVPPDAWGNEFIYRLNPENGAPFEIMSYGADGKPGGEGANADLHSTDRD